MRNPAIMARAMQSNFNGCVPKQITELGAGDGDLLLRVAQKLSPQWPDVNVTLLDRQGIVSAETLAAFASLGWRARSVVADVFDWSPVSAEVVIANLFLHHFEDARLAELLAKISERTRLFIAIEPHRFVFPFLCGRLLWLIGCNSVTRHDAVISIRAGFFRHEITALWPGRKHWRLTEGRRSMFSHLFVAQKIA
jgi:hypothetical protein